jgi:son of sevenless
VFLLTLYQLEDGNPDIVDSLINFKKREMIFNVIAEIQQYQQTPYKIDPADNYLSFLVEIPIVEDTKAMDNDLWELSLQREPRNTQSKADLL